jgi:hypothetical protein
MIFNIFKNGFSRFWKSINFAVVSSLISTVNPFTILLVMYANFLISTRFEKLIQYPASVTGFMVFLFALQYFFPTAFAMVSLQKRTIDNESISYKEFFKDFWGVIVKLLIPWLGLTLFFSISILLIVWTGSFYYEIIPNTILKTLIIAFIFFIFSIFIVTEYLFFPLYAYEEYKIKVSNALKFAMEIALRNILLLLPLFIFDVGLFFGFLFVPYGNILLIATVYFGLTNYIKLYLYHEMIRKYTEVKPGKPQYVKVGNEPSPWLDLLQSKKEVLKKN